MKRHLHYEAAFEDYLGRRAVPYVPVDETRKVIFSGSKIKSFDFLVYPAENCHWIVDVKGRRFPYFTDNGRRTARYWENWVTNDDVTGLADWQAVFGSDFEARFVFAYLLQGPADRWPTGRPHGYLGSLYAFLTVTLDDYRRHCRRRSTRWGTVTVPRRVFQDIAHPVGSFCA
ncbi:MAG: HYExAFE family protein [Planctomycetes bacterium]|nr:HYExAFE family protein [Planctomycetota bacterium]